VIGGGLAGLAAACALLDRGVGVTLLERRPFLGGRAFSFSDPETGQEVDNGQHVFLGCCTAYIGLLERLGVLGRVALQERVRVPVRDRGGRTGILAGVPWLPSPLHLLPSFLAYPHLGLREMLGVLGALRRIRRMDREEHRDALERQTFRHWLEAHGQSPRAIQRFWDIFALPTLNDAAEAVSAYMGFMVFQDGLMGGRHSANIGYSRVGLTALVSEAARAYIEGRGGKLLLERPATALSVEGDHVVAVEASGGQRIAGDFFVSAVPWDTLPRLLPPQWASHPFFAPAMRLEAAPIVGLHLWYDRPVMEEEFVAFLDSPIQWVFNKSRIQGRREPGQYLCISLSGAWEYAPLSKEELQRRFTQEMARVFPKAAEARLERFIVVKQLAATFRSTPGAQACRPPQRTPLRNLFLAGDWTQTGWPSTMESAVRSGLLAAQEAGK
jgi:squalene-associated FAD-dependent desaturase